MKLAICIPTHHGRAVHLRQLLESIAEQQAVPPEHRVEICISDNASNDGTAELVEAHKSTSPFPIKYFRFPTDMRGVRNFVNVIDMAEAEYCWLVGSDDVLLPLAIATVLRTLESNRGVGGVTVNKLNFDKELRSFVGVDHEVVLPNDPGQTRRLTSFAEVFSNLAMLFTYMSAHVFRKEDWQRVVREVGIDYLLTLRHFPHWYVFVRIAKSTGTWFWVADFLVIQRLDNFCLLEEAGDRKSVYATEVTEDLVRIRESVLDSETAHHDAMLRNLFLIYWNPWIILKYKAWPGISRDEQRAMRRRCVQWFGGVPLFWWTSYPVLVTPASLIRPSKRIIDAVYDAARSASPDGALMRWGRETVHLLLRAFRIEGKATAHIDAGTAAATLYIRHVQDRDRRG